MPVTSTASSSSDTSSQKLGAITMDQGQIQAKINLSEIDIPKVTIGQQATITMDAFPGKTFTGRVLTIDTTGSVNSGVTTYPVTLGLDTALNTIYPNMAVNAKIITSVKNNVLLVPSAAVTSSNGESSVRVMKDGQVTVTPVEVGQSNDTQVEIASGLQEGETVITGGGSTTRTGQGGTTSPFSNLNRGFGGGGGGGTFIRRGG
jgi:RND family efflux transporter MFP subunit